MSSKEAIKEESVSKEEVSQEDNSEKESVEEEVILETLEEIKEELTKYLNESYYGSNLFKSRILTDQIRHLVIKFTMDEKIAFKQIIVIGDTLKSQKEKIIGTLERNLSVFKKESIEYKEKHNQEIMFMDQAEVKSIKTIKEG